MKIGARSLCTLSGLFIICRMLGALLLAQSGSPDTATYITFDAPGATGGTYPLSISDTGATPQSDRGRTDSKRWCVYSS